jgi:hypothetical protein
MAKRTQKPVARVPKHVAHSATLLSECFDLLIADGLRKDGFDGGWLIETPSCAIASFRLCRGVER